MDNCYTTEELSKLGVIFGRNVNISRSVSIYCSSLKVGDNVRIDDYCVLCGDIQLGGYIHIGNFCGLYGRSGIEVQDFAGISSRCSLYSQSDDFSGNFLTGPTVPVEFTNVKKGKISIGKHSVVGAGSMVLPGVDIGECSALGAMSLATKSIAPFEIHVGCPAKFLKKRNDKFSELEDKLRNGHSW